MYVHVLQWVIMYVQTGEVQCVYFIMHHFECVIECNLLFHLFRLILVDLTTHLY